MVIGAGQTVSNLPGLLHREISLKIAGDCVAELWAYGNQILEMYTDSADPWPWAAGGISISSIKVRERYAPIGQWVYVHSSNDELSTNMQVSMTYTDSSGRDVTTTKELTTSVEAGLSFEGIGGLSTSMSLSDAKSVAIMIDRSFANTSGYGMEVKCSPKGGDEKEPNYPVTLYQFVVYSKCIRANTPSHFCSYRASNETRMMPACLPKLCCQSWTCPKSCCGGD